MIRRPNTFVNQTLNGSSAQDAGPTRHGTCRIVTWTQIVMAGMIVVSFSTTGWGQFTAPNRSPSSSHNGRADASGQRAVSTGIVLREGTRVGPMLGRFVVSGQRWRFLPDQVVSSTSASDLLENGLARKIQADRDTALGRGSGGISLNGSSRSEMDRRHSVGARSNAATPQLSGEMSAKSLQMILVIENLMLDRITRAIEEDPQDSHWMITGEITEFHDENRLMVLTAHRAPLVNDTQESQLSSRQRFPRR